MRKIYELTLTFKEGKKKSTLSAHVNNEKAAGQLIKNLRKKLPKGTTMRYRCKSSTVYSKTDVDKILRDLIRD